MTTGNLIALEQQPNSAKLAVEIRTAGSLRRYHYGVEK